MTGLNALFARCITSGSRVPLCDPGMMENAGVNDVDQTTQKVPKRYDLLVSRTCDTDHCEREACVECIA